ncbi:MAG: AI-2E family transporter [Gammaproteobacteria bacterium]|nr:AI-2E family transporter [Gammaproteobacteria bacterium]
MNESQKWLLLIGLSIIGMLLYLLAPVLTPFLIAALFAYMGDPLVDRLESYKLPRSIAVTVVFIVIFSIVLTIPFIFIPLLEQQISSFLSKLPGYIQWLQTTIVPDLAKILGVNANDLDFSQVQNLAMQHWQEAGGLATSFLSSAKQSGLVMLAWMANIVLVPVVTFYLLRDWDILISRIRELIPRKYESDAVNLAKSSDAVLGAFLRGQLSVMLCLGVVYALGLWAIGIDIAILIGIIAGVVSFVPYLGFIVGILLASAAAFMQFHEFLPLIWVALVFGIGQALEGMVLTPLLVGDKIGLHPVAVIFAVLAGGQLFGFLGILVALPAAAVAMVLIRHAHERYVGSELYSGES